jgi:hypothetical protein
MGEVLFHTGLALKVIDGVERLIRQVPGRLAVVAVIAGTIFSRDIRVDDSDDSDAWFVDAASNAIAWIQSRFSNRPDHGDWRSRYAHSAVSAHRLAR